MIDLIPEEYYRQQGIKLRQFGLLIGGLIIIVLLAFFSLNYFNLIIRNNVLDKKIKIANNQLQQVRGKTTKVLKLKRETNQLRSKLAEKKEVMGTRTNWGLILQELNQVLTDSSWLVQCQITETNQFRLRGFALQQDDLRVVIKNLKESAYFNDVVVNLTNKTNFSKAEYPKKIVFEYQISGQVAIKGGR